MNVERLSKGGIIKQPCNSKYSKFFTGVNNQTFCKMIGLILFRSEIELFHLHLSPHQVGYSLLG
jgi:hypothetical protein